jgi:hypothetical protein
MPVSYSSAASMGPRTFWFQIKVLSRSRSSSRRLLGNAVGLTPSPCSRQTTLKPPSAKVCAVTAPEGPEPVPSCPSPTHMMSYDNQMTDTVAFHMPLSLVPELSLLRAIYRVKVARVHTNPHAALRLLLHTFCTRQLTTHCTQARAWPSVLQRR